MKSESDRIQEVRARWATGLLLALSLVVVAWALVVQAMGAAAAFGLVAVFFAVMLWLLPPSWNRFVVDILSNFGW
ncbi:hypothetical protein [Acidovorax sp. Q11]